MIHDNIKEQFEEWYTRQMKHLTNGLRSALLSLPSVKKHMYAAYEQGHVAGMYYQYQLEKEKQVLLTKEP